MLTTGLTCSCPVVPQDINAVEEAKKNLAARGSPMPEGYCQVVLMRPARDA